MRRVAQLSFDDARRKAPAGPAVTVLPDAARVEEHLVRRAAPAVFGPVACTLAQLERGLVREARAAVAAQGARAHVRGGARLDAAARADGRGARGAHARAGAPSLVRPARPARGGRAGAPRLRDARRGASGAGDRAVRSRRRLS